MATEENVITGFRTTPRFRARLRLAKAYIAVAVGDLPAESITNAFALTWMAHRQMDVLGVPDVPSESDAAEE